jgi:hypothetical protein
MVDIRCNATLTLSSVVQFVIMLVEVKKVLSQELKFLGRKTAIVLME